MIQEIVIRGVRSLSRVASKLRLRWVWLQIYKLSGEWCRKHINVAKYTQDWWPPILAGREERRISHLLADLDGLLNESELRWLYKQVRALPERANILELSPGAGQTTCCLALGCRGSSRRVYTLWPESAGDLSREMGKTFVVWHQNVIRKNLVPYVTPVLVDDNGAIPVCPDLANFLYLGQDPLYSYTNVSVGESVLVSLLPKALVVQQGEPLLLYERLCQGSRSPFGSLSYGYWHNDACESLSVR